MVEYTCYADFERGGVQMLLADDGVHMSRADFNLLTV